jgi:hypothetical protein
MFVVGTKNSSIVTGAAGRASARSPDRVLDAHDGADLVARHRPPSPRARARPARRGGASSGSGMSGTTSDRIESLTARRPVKKPPVVVVERFDRWPECTRSTSPPTR